MPRDKVEELELLHVGFNQVCCWRRVRCHSPSACSAFLQSQLLTAFNALQDYGCFACGTASGFRIYNCEPFRETVSTLRSSVRIWSACGKGASELRLSMLLNITKFPDHCGAVSAGARHGRHQHCGDAVPVQHPRDRRRWQLHPVPSQQGGQSDCMQSPGCGTAFHASRTSAAQSAKATPWVQVMIWDDHQGRCIGELSFRSQVIVAGAATALRGIAACCKFAVTHLLLAADVACTWSLSTYCTLAH